MHKTNNHQYAKAVAKRIEKLMALSGLEISGFAEFTDVSESHIYAILNVTRDLTGGFNLEGWQILKLNYKIPQKIKDSKLLNNFYVENKDVPSFFTSTRPKRKDSHFIEVELLSTNFFNKPVYVWEVRDICAEANKKYTSKRISQILNYLVDIKKLKKTKKQIKLRNGGYGNRMVDVFFKQKE